MIVVLKFLKILLYLMMELQLKVEHQKTLKIKIHMQNIYNILLFFIKSVKISNKFEVIVWKIKLRT